MSNSEVVGPVAGQWTVLRAGAQDSAGLEIPSLPLGTLTAAGPIRLALGPRGEARLLLPLAAPERPAAIDSGNGLSVTLSTFMQNGRALRFLDLTCLVDDLEPVFGEVVDEIVSRVSSGAGCIDAARNTLDDFRTLLTRTPAPEIDSGRIAGLVAELVILNRFLEISAAAWRTWKGPAGDRHDFRKASDSLEVKASFRAGALVTINGLEQLEAPSGGTLHLVHFVLEPVAGGLLTVAGLGGSALARADDPASLSDLLVAAGCHDVQSEMWNRYAFRVEAESLYRVADDFPRLVPSTLASGRARAGVRDVVYRIDLSLAIAQLCTAPQLRDLLQRLAQ